MSNDRLALAVEQALEARMQAMDALAVAAKQVHRLVVVPRPNVMLEPFETPLHEAYDMSLSQKMPMDFLAALRSIN